MGYATKNTIKRLARDLNLSRGDINTQDWEYEVADSKKLDEFLAYLTKNELNSNERQTLMQVILESYNDYVTEFGYNNDYSKKIKMIIQKDISIYKDIIWYWSCGEEDLEDCFAITSFMRGINEA